MPEAGSLIRWPYQDHLSGSVPLSDHSARRRTEHRDALSLPVLLSLRNHALRTLVDAGWTTVACAFGQLATKAGIKHCPGGLQLQAQI